MLMHEAFAIEDDPAAISINADPHGIACGERGALYVADAAAGAILRITDERVDRVAGVDAGAGRIAGVALAPDGTMFVTRVGPAGAVFAIPAGGEAVALAKLPQQLWRLGLVYDATEHVLYATQFLMSKFGAHEGSIISVDLRSGQPSMLLDGFHQPIGIAKLGRTLIIADARMRAVFRVELVAGRAVSRYQLATTLDRPTSLCAAGGDSVLLASYDQPTQLGSVRRLWLDGRVEDIASGAWEPRGVASDRRRAFVTTARGQVLSFDLST
jgi:hypothetical protein